MRTIVTFDEAIVAAANLVSEDGENPEYDRAIHELLVDMFGLGYDMDHGRQVAAALIYAHREQERADA